MMKNTVTKKELAFIKKLAQKKYRNLHSAFVASGAKTVLTLLASSAYSPSYIIATPAFTEQYPKIASEYENIWHIAQEAQYKAVDTLSTNPTLLAVFAYKVLSVPYLTSGDRMLILDNIRNPGNLGTLVRVADWYGIKDIIASPTTVDCYNPKVIQASMGSIAHVKVHYTPLLPYLQHAKAGQIPIIGGVLDGKNLYQTTLPQYGGLLIGNEAAGIDKSLRSYIQYPVTIPAVGQAESLNAAIAGAILCDHWQRVS